jgi:hypothetical protein
MHSATLASGNGEVANKSSPPMDLPPTPRRAILPNHATGPNSSVTFDAGTRPEILGMRAVRPVANVQRTMCVHAFIDPAYFVNIFQTPISSGLAEFAPSRQPSYRKRQERCVGKRSGVSYSFVRASKSKFQLRFEF